MKKVICGLMSVALVVSLFFSVPMTAEAKASSGMRELTQDELDDVELYFNNSWDACTDIAGYPDKARRLLSFIVDEGIAFTDRLTGIEFTWPELAYTGSGLPIVTVREFNGIEYFEYGEKIFEDIINKYYRNSIDFKSVRKLVYPDGVKLYQDGKYYIRMTSLIEYNQGEGNPKGYYCVPDKGAVLADDIRYIEVKTYYPYGYDIFDLTFDTYGVLATIYGEVYEDWIDLGFKEGDGSTCKYVDYFCKIYNSYLGKTPIRQWPKHLSKLILKYADGTSKYSGKMILVYKDNGNKGKELLEIIGPESNKETAIKYVKKKYANEVDVTIDYVPVREFAKESEYVAYLKKILKELDGARPSDQSIADIVRYVEYAIENSATVEAEAKRKKFVITKEMIQKALEKAENAKSDFDKLLLKYDIESNKNIKIDLKIIVNSADVKKGIKVEFEPGVAELLGDADGIRIVFDKKYHGMYVESENLAGLQNSGCSNFEMKKRGDKYTIVFLSDNNKTIDKAKYPVMFSVPAPNEYCSILAEYKGGKDNWGGQYDAGNRTLEFKTRFSGDYSVLEKKIKISDIDALSEDAKQAIRFMVSKGYFELNGDRFEPNLPLSRYDFTTSLVKMFFALDRDARSKFKDVPVENQYYPYIASAEDMGIAKGFEDGTFRGERLTSKQEVIAFSAKTLAEKKGYKYPENVDSYLNFSDVEDISNWAKEDIGLAVKCGLISGEGELNPKTDITKAEGAEILYKLFMLLYDTEPVSMEEEESDMQTLIILGCAGAALAVGIAAVAVRNSRYRKKTDGNMRSEEGVKGDKQENL